LVKKRAKRKNKELGHKNWWEEVSKKENKKDILEMEERKNRKGRLFARKKEI